MSGSQSPNRADEAMSESSQNRQSEPLREATPRPEQATHKVIENFMIKMTELLETSMATRRNKQLNDMYDTLKYEDALRNQPWTWNDFQEELKKEYIPRWVCEEREDEFQQLRQGNLAIAQYTTKFNRLAKYCLRLIDIDENKTRQFLPCHRWDSRPQLKLPRERRWLIKLLYRGKQPLVQRRLHINVLDTDHGNLEISRDPKLRLCFKCGKPGHTKDQCPEMQQVPPEMSRKAGRPRS
ncbi:hypothetical protein M9H77_13466 [Catharanthus roseus]|uniref:Uncharacterized protein n=1 Tax=Catharanthus roseus TaxID=4058 RepID=A0ACC0BK87_CATRO|nr:hypothetical protein M9H77_13466 [Catharanthus roseus]